MSNIIDYTNRNQFTSTPYYSKNKEHGDAVDCLGYFLSGRGNGKTLLTSAIHDLVNLPYFGIDNIKDVIFNDPATIVLWSDGTKTVVKCRDGETFDPEKGLALALAKKAMGNKYDYYEVFNKYVGKYNKKKFQKALNEARNIIPDEIIRNGRRYVLEDRVLEADVVEARPKDEEDSNNEV